MFQLLPYGATINLTCTSCSKKGKKIDNYTDSEHYTIIEDDLGKNNNYFLTSDREPIEMTYSYTAKNGILVGIETNLQIKNKNLGSNGAGSFTISNENWFNNQNKPTPYIKLLFNKVKVECCFVNPFGADDPGYGSNGWSGLQNGGDEFFIPYSLNNNNTSSCKLKRYITVSWSTSEDNENMCLEINKGNSGYWFQGWFSYGDTNGNIYSFDHHKDSSLTKQRLWNDYNGIQDYFFLTVPPLNGTGSIGHDESIPIANYFKIGYTINFFGEEAWQPDSLLYVNGRHYVYNKNGTCVLQNLNNEILEGLNSTPALYKHPRGTIWGNSTSTFYKIYEQDKYLSPANGIEILSVRDYGCIDCECDDGCNNENGCGCNDACNNENCGCNDGCNNENCGCNDWCNNENCGCNDWCNNENCGCNDGCNNENCECDDECNNENSCTGYGQYIEVDFWSYVYPNTNIRQSPNIDSGIVDAIPYDAGNIKAHFSRQYFDGSYYWYYADSITPYAEGWIRGDRIQ